MCNIPIIFISAAFTVFVFPQIGNQKKGKITAYSPTNTLIIKDQPSVVRMLIKVIKGRADLSECLNFQNGPEGSNKIP
ncbi:MAG: hypothetical protein KJP23_10315 [Deltaproteobacteria bacterium]|nr:hypothetical protein [Deltaproteobacteria bacterium]